MRRVLSGPGGEGIHLSFQREQTRGVTRVTSFVSSALRLSAGKARSIVQQALAQVTILRVQRLDRR
jgi:hypothetical protein